MRDIATETGIREMLNTICLSPEQRGQSDYTAFLERKSQMGSMGGFAPTFIPSFLFDFQTALAEWGVRKGRNAIFADCGLGKTPIQLVWSQNVIEHTNKPVLVLTPLAVSFQTLHESEKFSIDAVRSGNGTFTGTRIVVTNYERLHYFNPNDFAGVVCDECFPKNTPIECLRNDNSLELRYIQDIRPGDKILNANGVDYVKEIYKRPIKRAVRVGVSGRDAITCSENHPFFTVHGWRSAKDLQPGDCLVETKAAVRLVREGIPPAVCSSQVGKILRTILFSEMENETAGDFTESARAGRSAEARREEVGMAALWTSFGTQGACQNSGIEFTPNRRIQEENLIDFAEDEARTFRAWWQWEGFDHAAAQADGCTIRRLDTGIAYITGPTGTRFSDALQSGHRQLVAQDWDRTRWTFTPEPQGSRLEERSEIGVARVDSVEILELGHPDLDQFRDAEGQLYFYDIKATQHPSFTVNGLLVHNSGILKSFDGVTRKAVTEFMRKMPYRLLCTATPSPNDFIELGTSSEALGELGHMDMLARFFKNDNNTADVKGHWKGHSAPRMFEQKQWRFKGHAEMPFWQWVCSWARAIRKPSDLGFDDARFVLPPLIEREHLIESMAAPDGMLFTLPAVGLTEQRAERRRTLDLRCEKVAELVNPTGKPALVWCHLNPEGDLLEKLIPDAIQVSGRDSDEVKEEKFLAFVKGEARVLITKPKIGAWGLNLQHCAHETFFPSHSYEQYYQGVRRCYRFGQTQPVTVDIITTPGEQNVLKNLQRKAGQADRMFQVLVKEMSKAAHITRDIPFAQQSNVPSWLTGETS